MIKPYNHSVSIIIHAENILVKRFVYIINKTGYSVTVIQCANERSLTLS